MTANDRRMQILETLCARRHEIMANLASEFNVSFMTIRRDIEVLSCSYPLYTTKGTGGGVHIMDGYRFGMKYLSDEQAEVLTRLSKNLKGADLKTVLSILTTFRPPKRKR